MGFIILLILAYNFQPFDYTGSETKNIICNFMLRPVVNVNLKASNCSKVYFSLIFCTLVPFKDV